MGLSPNTLIKGKHMNQEYNKKPASQTKKEKRYTRQEQYEHGPERKSSYARRRWGNSTKAQRQALEAIYPGRNLISFPLSFYVTNSNNLLARNKNYIITKSLKSKKNLQQPLRDFDNFGFPTSNLAYAYQNVQMLGTDMTDAEYKWHTNHDPYQRPQKNQRVMTVYNENDSQPDYVSQLLEKATEGQRDTPRTNLRPQSQESKGSAKGGTYSLWKQEERPKRDPFQQAQVFQDWMDSEAGINWIKLHGKEVAQGWGKRIVTDKMDR
jgi:hypothetical protein